MKNLCSEEELIADYLVGRLPDEERRHFEEYFADHDQCLEELLVAKKLMRDSGLPDSEPVPEAVTERAVQLLTNQVCGRPSTLKMAVFGSF